MNSIIYENYTSGLNHDVLDLMSLISIVFGIYVIISKNPIVSVLFLIGLFCAISVYLMLIGLHFIGLSYLIIYVGAISVLFIFIVMLINVRISELLTENNNSIPLAILTVLSFNYSTYINISYNASLYNTIYGYMIYYLSKLMNITIPVNSMITGNDTTGSSIYHMSNVGISDVYSRSWDTIMVMNTHASSIGNVLYTNFFILFLITALILAIAMVGAISITVNKSNTNSIVNNKITYNLN